MLELDVLRGFAVAVMILIVSPGAWESALASIPLYGSDSPKTLQRLGFEIASRVFADPYLASFACALAVLAFVVMLLWPLQRRGIHLRL